MGLETSWGIACCSTCPNHPFCSPVSGNCYNYKGKHYYSSCSAQTSGQNCCSMCGNWPFCSPVSGRCYANQAKSYYQTCASQAPQQTSFNPSNPGMPAQSQQTPSQSFPSQAVMPQQQSGPMQQTMP